MQTERVTFLTTPEHKSALDAFAASSGRSVGHVLREASSRYIADGSASDDEYEEALALVVPELEAMLPRWNARMDSMEKAVDDARQAVRAAIGSVEASKHASLGQIERETTGFAEAAE